MDPNERTDDIVRDLYEEIVTLCPLYAKKSAQKRAQEGARSDCMSKLPFLTYSTPFPGDDRTGGVAYRLCGALRAGGAEFFCQMRVRVSLKKRKGFFPPRFSLAVPEFHALRVRAQRKGRWDG
ncbi:hypothetical protein MPNT_50110 [Candidatus Methylacidithermus pantelleriae]|uniref:Uncharacterized protein n=1 Tax=Candidatus Methylacidithermus pantelleriae TaxID=2744239 RepID=A0A8J2FTH7_9BACT|nr:hypothetical protein MPNT_50110 [Candidatus Methylacidithermus pantelleriae]